VFLGTLHSTANPDPPLRAARHKPSALWHLARRFAAGAGFGCSIPLISSTSGLQLGERPFGYGGKNKKTL